MQGIAFLRCGDSERIVLIAAVCVPDKIRANPSLICIASLAVRIHTDKYDIVIGIAFIKPSRTDTEIYQVIVDTSAV